MIFYLIYLSELIIFIYNNIVYKYQLLQKITNIKKFIYSIYKLIKEILYLPPLKILLKKKP